MTAAPGGKSIGHPGIARDADGPTIVDKLNRMARGELNVTQAAVTLRASQTTTTLSDPRLSATSFVGFMPLTAHAAAAAPGIWVSNQLKGSCTVNHASSANADQTFTALIIG